MRARLLVAALLLAPALPACGEHSPTVERAVLPQVPAPLDDLTQRFGRLRRRMEERGYGDAHAVTRAFLLEGDGRAFPLDLPTARCTTFIALGGGTVRRLAVSLFDGGGDEIAQQDGGREAGLVHVCPQRGGPRAGHRPYHLVVRSMEGTGAVVVGAFESSQGSGEGFEHLFDGLLLPREPLREIEEALGQLRAALRARGLSLVGEATLSRVPVGGAVRRSELLAEGKCYVVAAQPGQGLSDVDLFVYDGAGAEVARNLDVAAAPTLELCPESAGRHTIEARAFQGSGALGLMVLERPVDEATGTPAANPPPEAPHPSLATDPLAALGAVIGELTARGYSAPLFVVRDGSINPGEVRVHDVVLGPGCAVVVGAGGGRTLDLDLYLADENGAAVDRDTRVAPRARVTACPPSGARHRVSVKAYGGDGRYALAVLKAPAEIADVLGLRIDEATHGLLARGLVLESERREAIAAGERTSETLDVPPGQCAAVAVAGNAGVSDVDLFLRDAEGTLLASEAGPEPWASVVRCAEEGAPESLEVEVVAYDGEGEVEVRRFGSRP